MNWIQKAGLKVLKEKSTVKMDELRMYIERSEEHEFGRWYIERKCAEVGPGKASVLRKLIDKII